MAANGCYTCRYLLRFTPEEKAIMEPKLTSYGLGKNYFGACTAPWEIQPSLIRRYIQAEIKHCQYYQGGRYSESMKIPCSNCKVGHIEIKRPIKNRQSYILIGCSNYPDCRYVQDPVRLKINCRFCNIPLSIKGGSVLTCFCSSCHHALKIPLMLSSWPTLMKKGRQCPHNKVWDECSICEKSQLEKISLIDLELPATVELWHRLLLPRYDFPVDLDEEDYFWDEIENYWDTTEDDEDPYMEYTNDFIENMGHELEGGWFYEE